MADLDLRPERRNELTARLRAGLETLVPGSSTSLRGSLASGTADPYSDIDLCWVVENESFAKATSAITETATTFLAVQAVRIDPSLARSDRRRLIYLRLVSVPLFWRVDLDLRFRSVASDDRYDDENPAAHDATLWSPAASAIENAAAAIKSSLRGQDDTTSGLLSRGYARIELAPPPEASTVELISGLATACALLSPNLAGLAKEIRQVAEICLRPPQAPS